MQRRALFSLLNVAMAAGVLVVLFAFPRYAGYAVYAFFGWFVVSISVVWLARSTPPVASPSSGAAPGGAGALPTGPGRPLAGTSATVPPIGFCIYCAADLPADAVRCAACGHPARRLV